jgi:hypothetical protein
LARSEALAAAHWAINALAPSEDMGGTIRAELGWGTFSRKEAQKTATGICVGVLPFLALQPCNSAHGQQSFGLRWQSAAATLPFVRTPASASGVALRFPPHSKRFAWKFIHETSRSLRITSTIAVPNGNEPRLFFGQDVGKYVTSPCGRLIYRQV